MPYASNDGVRIHHHGNGTPDGPLLVLHCGFPGNLRSWYGDGYVDALRGTENGAPAEWTSRPGHLALVQWFSAAYHLAERPGFLSYSKENGRGERI